MLRISAKILIALAYLSCISYASVINAAPAKSLEDRIDESFSNIESGLSEEEARKLRNVNITEDDKDNGSMTVVDSNGVIHDFYDGLWQKIIHIKPNAPTKPILALGIGMTRNKKSVLNTVRKFTGRKAMECSVQPDGSMDARKFGYMFCKQYIIGGSDGAYVWVAFDKQDRLIIAGYQAWDPF
jgi:hypothetical protein